MSIAVLSSCSSSKSDPANQAPNGTPLPPGFESSADESFYDISNFESLKEGSPEYNKFVKENLAYRNGRKVQDTKNLNGLENVEEYKTYYSFGTLVNQSRERLSFSTSDKNKLTVSSYAMSILFNNESLLKNSNTLLATLEAEVKEESCNGNNQDICQTLSLNYDSYKNQYDKIEDIVNLNLYKKWNDLYEAEFTKYPFLNCKNIGVSSGDDNSLSVEYYKHKTIDKLYYTKTKYQGQRKCEDENNSYDIGNTILTHTQIYYFAHESWFNKEIYSEFKAEYLDHNYTSRTIHKVLQKNY